jgi:rhodanese-related sulfurtransferase
MTLMNCDLKGINMKILGVTTALTCSALLAVMNAHGAESSRITAEKLRTLQLNKQVSIIDVRPPSDFASGHIQGARNIAAADVSKAGLDKATAVTIYCAEDPCALTTSAAQQLSANGYATVWILEGGLPSWTAKGYPLKTGDGHPADRARKTIPAKEAKRRLDAGTALAVDTRPAAEFAAGHLPGASNAPLETFNETLARLPKDKELIVYDREAGRSRTALLKLEEAGFKASDLAGGLAGWLKRRLPLEVK